jgi:hypothetical protein
VTYKRSRQAGVNQQGQTTKGYTTTKAHKIGKEEEQAIVTTKIMTKSTTFHGEDLKMTLISKSLLPSELWLQFPLGKKHNHRMETTSKMASANSMHT